MSLEELSEAWRQVDYVTQQFDDWESRIVRMESDFQFLASSAAQLDIRRESTEPNASAMEKAVEALEEALQTDGAPPPDGRASRILLDKLQRLEALLHGTSPEPPLDSPPAPPLPEEEEEEIREAVAQDMPPPEIQPASPAPAPPPGEEPSDSVTPTRPNTRVTRIAAAAALLVLLVLGVFVFRLKN
jgi:hypothetical protein